MRENLNIKVQRANTDKISRISKCYN